MKLTNIGRQSLIFYLHIENRNFINKLRFKYESY